MTRSLQLAESSAPPRLRALPIIALEPARPPPRPVLALAPPCEVEDDLDPGSRRSQLPTLPGPMWGREETPTRPMFEHAY